MRQARELEPPGVTQSAMRGKWRPQTPGVQHRGCERERPAQPLRETVSVNISIASPHRKPDGERAVTAGLTPLGAPAGWRGEETGLKGTWTVDSTGRAASGGARQTIFICFPGDGWLSSL